MARGVGRSFAARVGSLFLRPRTYHRIPYHKQIDAFIQFVRSTTMRQRQTFRTLLYPRRVETKFVIISRARVGSTLLVSLLGSHPHVRCYGELFSPFVLRHRKYARDEPDAFLRRYVFGRYPDRVRAAGFKLFYTHARRISQHIHREVDGVLTGRKATKLEAVWRLLRADKSIRIIHLRRRNILAAHVSYRRAIQNQRWTSHQPGAQRGLAPLSLSFDECRRVFEETRQLEKECETTFADHSVLELYYEDLVGNIDAEMLRVQRFLGVEPKVLPTTMERQNRAALRDQIRDYADIKTRFEGTEWAPFFAE